MESKELIARSFSELYFCKSLPQSPPVPSQTFNCLECDSSSLQYDSLCDETICPNCGLVQHYNQAMPVHRGYLPDTFSKIKSTQYKEVVYLKLRLTELQCGVEKIPLDMIEKLEVHFKSHPLNIYTLRKALNYFGYKQLYLRIPIILYTLDPEKYPPMRLTSRQVSKIVNLFKHYLSIWQSLPKSKRCGRKNFLNYQFVLKKIFIQLGLESCIKFLNLPRGKKTLKEHEYIWSLLT